jgi:hypothetical protein
VRPSLGDQRERRNGLRRAVHKVTDRQHPVMARIESNSLEFLFELRSMTVKVTHHKISPKQVPGRGKATSDL